MSWSFLPPEIVDYVIGLLHDEPTTLRNCCLVSKSWFPHARKYLFREVSFPYQADLGAWEDTFPDPVNSPGDNTRSLFVRCATGVEESRWVQAFSNVVRLEMGTGYEIWPASQLFNLVCSLPLLEDLDVMCYSIRDDGPISWPPTSPPLTGSLQLCLRQWVESTLQQILDLPNGPQFRKLKCVWHRDEDFRWVRAAVEACADNLECVTIQCGELEVPQADSIDFSKAVKLKKVVFRFEALNDVWVASSLKTLTTNHRDLSQISIDIPGGYLVSSQQTMGEVNRQWEELDRALVQLWELNKIHTQAIYRGIREEGAYEHVEKMLPEMTKRGIVELVKQPMG